MLVAAGAVSSEAAYSRQAFRIDKKTVGFKRPLGYAFNRDGSMMYQAFAAIFIAKLCVAYALGERMPAAVPSDAAIA